VSVPKAEPELLVRDTGDGRPLTSRWIRQPTPNVTWQIPASMDLQHAGFQGGDGSDAVGDWNLLKSIVGAVQPATRQESRSSSVPTPDHVADKVESVADAKRNAKQAIAGSNYNEAASAARAGLKRGKDLALRFVTCVLAAGCCLLCTVHCVLCAADCVL
jgi:hypothetical protein